MAVFLVRPAGDLKLENGDLVIIDGADYLRQRLAARFKFFLGEWFLDQREGVPYYRDVLRKNPSIDVIRSVFRKVILTTPGIAALRRFDLQFDRRTRELKFDFEAVRADGTVIAVNSSDAPFIVRP